MFFPSGGPGGVFARHAGPCKALVLIVVSMCRRGPNKHPSIYNRTLNTLATLQKSSQ
jgi:hypothetical protein